MSKTPINDEAMNRTLDALADVFMYVENNGWNPEIKKIFEELIEEIELSETKKLINDCLSPITEIDNQNRGPIDDK